MRLASCLVVLTSLSAALPLLASEIAVLDNGMRIPALSVERQGERAVLHTRDGGQIEIATVRLASVEHVDDPLPAAVTPATAPAEPPTPPKSVRELIDDAALRYGLPPEIVHGVAQAESAYQPTAVSPKGAIGVMQLMPGTAKKLDADPRDVAQNIDAGTRLLRDLLLRYEGSENGVRRALAAYNAGEGAVDRYNGVPPYRETQGYVERVIGLYWKKVHESERGARVASTDTAPAATAAASGAGAN